MNSVPRVRGKIRPRLYTLPLNFSGLRAGFFFEMSVAFLMQIIRNETCF